jgi:hypothetical protein
VEFREHRRAPSRRGLDRGWGRAPDG